MPQQAPWQSKVISARRAGPSPAMRALLGAADIVTGDPSIDQPRISSALTPDGMARANRNFTVSDPLTIDHPAFQKAKRGYEFQDFSDAIDDQNVRARDLGFAEDLADVSATRAADRRGLPAVAWREQQDFDRKMQGLTEPARIAAQGRTDTAALTGQYGVERAMASRKTPSPAEIIAGAMDDWTRSGVFGIDPSGRPMQPPEHIRLQAEELMNTLFTGARPSAAPGGSSSTFDLPNPSAQLGAGPAGPPPAGGAGAGDLQGLVQDLIAQGLARDEADALAGLKARGIIR